MKYVLTAIVIWLVWVVITWANRDNEIVTEDDFRNTVIFRIAWPIYAVWFVVVGFFMAMSIGVMITRYIEYNYSGFFDIAIPTMVACVSLGLGIFLFRRFRRAYVSISDGTMEYLMGNKKEICRLDDILLVYAANGNITVMLEDSKIELPMVFKKTSKLLAMLEYCATINQSKKNWHLPNM